MEQVRRFDRHTADAVTQVAALTQYAVYYRYPPRVPRQSHALRRDDVLRDLEIARAACTVLEAAIERRLVAVRGETQDRA